MKERKRNFQIKFKRQEKKKKDGYKEQIRQKLNTLQDDRFKSINTNNSIKYEQY